jgi:YD repeat-containing protein
VTITYDGDHVTSVHDPVPEDLVDVTYEYELQAARVVQYSEGAAGEVNESRTYTYDAEGRLIGSQESSYGDESTWTMTWNAAGEPAQLLQNGELACVYSWRHAWLGTTCYTAGAVSQTYEPDASGRLARLTSSGDTVAYTYDEAGRLALQESGDNAYTYEYSAEGKLIEASGPDFQEVRSYDASGLLRKTEWTDASNTTTATFTYERVAADEVIATETTTHNTIARTFKRLSHAPTGEPRLPSYWTLLRMDQPTVYMAPPDYSKVP